MASQPLRVLHIAETVAGGIASFLEEVVPHQVSAFGSENVRVAVPTCVEAHLPQIDPRQIISCGAGGRSPGKLLKFTTAAMRIIREYQPDVLHLHSSFAGATIRAATMLSGKASRPRIIYCPHGWSFGMDTRNAKKQLYAAVERRLAAVTDFILVVSQDEHDLAMRFGLPGEKTRVVRNGIAWAALPERKSKEDPIRIGFIGRHDRQKGLDILLDTIHRHRTDHLQFDIVGAGVLQQDSRSALPPSNVTFHGWLKRAETLEVLNTFDALVMPSRWDAAPIVAIEAMRAGVPVIASNRGGLPEIVLDGVGGYVFDLDDPDALGRILESLTREDLKRLSATARTRWEKEYVADKMNRLTLSAYRDALAAPAAIQEQAREPVLLRTHSVAE
jgi:glycosyltransferase involved in cell wall biosynthesis